MNIDVRPIIEKYIGVCHHVEQQEQMMHFCPQCNHKNPRLSVNYNKNAFKCWKCGWSGYSVSKILFDLDASREDIDKVRKSLGEYKKRELFGVKKNKLFEEVHKKLYKNTYKAPAKFDTSEWVPILKYESFLKNPALNYLLNERGLSTFEINYYNIQFNKAKHSLIIPSYDFKGNLNYYVERTIGNDGFYMNPKGISKQDNVFFEYLIDFRQPIIITEGVFDAIQIGYNSIPILGTFVSDKLRSYIESFDTPLVIFYFDTDARKEMVNVVEYLIKNGIKCSFIYCDDYEDAGKTPREIIKDLIDNTKPISKIDLTRIKLLT